MSAVCAPCNGCRCVRPSKGHGSLACIRARAVAVSPGDGCQCASRACACALVVHGGYDLRTCVRARLMVVVRGCVSARLMVVNRGHVCAREMSVLRVLCAPEWRELVGRLYTGRMCMRTGDGCDPGVCMRPSDNCDPCALFIFYNPLHGARRAMAAACRCSIGQRRAFLNNLFLPRTSSRSHSGESPTPYPRPQRKVI